MLSRPNKVFSQVLGFAANVALAISLFAGTPAAAQSYPIDLGIAMCTEKQSQNTALAINDFGTAICAWNHTTISGAGQDAKSKCTGYIPKSMRQSVQCRVVWENGKITDPAWVELARKPYRMPVTIEYYSGGKLTKSADGFMDMGPAPDKLTRIATISLANGQRVCAGAAKMRKLKLEFDFTAKCEDFGTLKGAAKVIGLRQIGGLQRLALDMTIKGKPNAIRIVTK